MLDSNVIPESLSLGISSVTFTAGEEFSVLTLMTGLVSLPPVRIPEVFTTDRAVEALPVGVVVESDVLQERMSHFERPAAVLALEGPLIAVDRGVSLDVRDELEGFQTGRALVGLRLLLIFLRF